MPVWVSGTNINETKLGTVADYCSVCGDIREFTLWRRDKYDHIYWIRVTKNRSRFNRVCTHCQTEFAADRANYAQVIPISQVQALSTRQLIQVTNPDLFELLETTPIQAPDSDTNAAQDHRAVVAEQRLNTIFDPPQRIQILKEELKRYHRLPFFFRERLLQEVDQAIHIHEMTEVANEFAARYIPKLPSFSFALGLGFVLYVILTILAFVIPEITDFGGKNQFAGTFVMIGYTATVALITIYYQLRMEWVVQRVIIPAIRKELSHPWEFGEFISSADRTRPELSKMAWKFTKFATKIRQGVKKRKPPTA